MQHTHSFVPRALNLESNRLDDLATVRAESRAGGSPGQRPRAMLNTAPDPAITVSEFVETRFVPQHVFSKTTSGRRHYQAILKHILLPAEVDRIFAVTQRRALKAKLIDNPEWPYLGHHPMASVTSDLLQQLISAAEQKGYSAQTVKHIRNVIRAIFSHAIGDGSFVGENPAVSVSIPEMNRREARSLSLAQTSQLLKRMHYPEREIALMAILTNMNIAEICGLQWMYVNLSDHFLTREGVSIPARSIAVRNQWYRGQLSPVPPARVKDIRMSPLMLKVLLSLSGTRTGGWHDFVLSTKSGRPINQINLAARRLKRIGTQLDMPWISWQVIRRTRQALADEYEAQVQVYLSKMVFPIP